MASLTSLKACMVVSSNDIRSLLRTAALTENPCLAIAFPCKIMRDALAKRERCGNILQPVTSVTHCSNMYMSAVGVMKMVFKEFKEKIWFLRTFKDRVNFLRNFKNFKTSGRPDNSVSLCIYCAIMASFWTPMYPMWCFVTLIRFSLVKYVCSKSNIRLRKGVVPAIATNR